MNEMDEKISRLKFWGIGSSIYALLFTLFLFHNPSGISYPFYIGTTLFFYCLCLKKSGLTNSNPCSLAKRCAPSPTKKA